MAHRPHARLAPSSAARWLRCPASVQFIEDEELEDESGVPAKEGTILHMLCEECLRDDLSPFKFVGQSFEYEGHHMEFTDALAEWMVEGLDYLDDIPGRIFIEKRLDLGRWMPGQFGTMDVGIIGRKRATLFDWKWGFLPVGAVDNDQLRIYALGFWDNYVRHYAPHIRKFRLIIWQPRAPGGGGEWDIDLDDLLEWGEDLKVAAKMTYRKDAKFVPGTTQCAYCPGATNLVCEAYKKFNRDLLDLDDDEMDEEIEMGIPLRLSSDGMTPERRSHILEHRTMINKFLDRLAAEEMDDATKGRPTPRRKLVLGRNPPRKYFDPEEAEKEIGLILSEEEAYTKKLISPTQLEKVVSETMYKRLEKELVDLGNPKNVMVPEGDRRPPVPNIKDELND
jgi:hypothetical protein